MFIITVDALSMTEYLLLYYYVKDLRESVLRGKYRVPFYMSTECENLIKKFLIINPLKRPSLQVNNFPLYLYSIASFHCSSQALYFIFTYLYNVHLVAHCFTQIFTLLSWYCYVYTLVFWFEI